MRRENGFRIDPDEIKQLTEKLYAVMMLQMPFVPAGHYRRAMREMVYGALVR